MLSTFAIIKHQIKGYKIATKQGSRRPFQRSQRHQSSSASPKKESIRAAATPTGNSFISTPSPPSVQSLAPKKCKITDFTTALQSHGRRALIQSTSNNITSYARLEPEMFYWIIASLLIIWGQGPAAFSLAILCIDHSRLSDIWLTCLTTGGRTIFIRREFCVLFNSILLTLWGCEKSAVFLFIIGTRPETFQKGWVFTLDLTFSYLFCRLPSTALLLPERWHPDESTQSVGTVAK